MTASRNNCHIKRNNEGFERITIGKETEDICRIKFTITPEMLKNADSDTLYVYYEIHSFYQNHRRYVKSRSDLQMRATDTVTDASLETSCDPADSFRNGTSGKIYWPCGLVAQSYFNDGIRLISDDLTMERTQIAWESDFWQKSSRIPRRLTTTSMSTFGKGTRKCIATPTTTRRRLFRA